MRIWVSSERPRLVNSRPAAVQAASSTRSFSRKPPTDAGIELNTSACSAIARTITGLFASPIQIGGIGRCTHLGSQTASCTR